MQLSVEHIAERIKRAIPCTNEQRHAYTIVRNRVHLARGPNQTLELFIEGARETFGTSAIGRSLEWGQFHNVAEERDFSALVVRAYEGVATTRLMAHLAYEAGSLLTTDPAMTNEEIILSLTPFISLVTKREILSLPQQMGLTAELMFLLELMNFAQQESPPIADQRILETWRGWDSASRDFYGPNLAIEVKATGLAVRKHRVHPMNQLMTDPQNPQETVYVYSVGLRPDRSSAFGVLMAYERVVEALSGDALSVFLDHLSNYGGVGFEIGLRTFYELEPGFSVCQPGVLFRVDNLDGVLRDNSFVGGAPPNRARDIRYDIVLEGVPHVSLAEREHVFRSLLGRQT